MITGPLLVTLGPGSDGGLAVVAAGTAVLSLLVLARLAGLVGLLARDVAQRRALEAQLSYQAFHDPLTGLSNRRRFVEPAETALAARGRDRLGRGAVPRPRRLQDRQRQPRPRRRRRAPDRGRGRASASACGRRMSPAGSAATSSASCSSDLPTSAYAVAVSERLLARLVEPDRGRAGVSIEVGASIGIAIVAAGWGPSTSCWATPTSRCTRPRPGARAGTRCSTRPLRRGRPAAADPAPAGNVARSPSDRPRSIGTVRLEPGAG